MSKFLQLLYLSNLTPDSRNYTLQNGEREVTVANPSLLTSKLFFLLLLVGIATSVLVVESYGLQVAGIVLGVTMFGAIVEYIRVRKTFYFVTNQRAIVSNSFLRQTIQAISYDEIEEVDDSHSWIESIFSVGTINFKTFSGETLQFKSVYNFREFERAIYTSLPEKGEEENLSSVISEDRLQNAEDDRLQR